MSSVRLFIAIYDRSPKGVKISMFADTAIWKTGSSVNEVRKMVQKALRSITKTSVVLFSRRMVKGKVKLKYEGKF